MENENKINKMKENFSDVFELPKEIVLDLPKIVMIGTVQVKIENHKGIIEYSLEKIRINSTSGIILILGKELIIKTIIKEEIIIEGKINQVHIV